MIATIIRKTLLQMIRTSRSKIKLCTSAENVIIWINNISRKMHVFFSADTIK